MAITVVLAYISYMKAPNNHTLTQTEDGSLSLFSQTFQEGCHSLSGARRETQIHYLEGCQILKKLASCPKISILEVGFGTGLGFELSRDLALKNAGHIIFHSLEIDPILTGWSFARLGLSPTIEKLSDREIWSSEDESFSLKVLVGNARATLPAYLHHFPQCFNAIYQDAFSPKKNPVLWTTEWFNLLKKYSSPDVILSTYSASNSIRKSLTEAGWSLRKGESFGPKRASTRACLHGESDQELLNQMNRSPALAITDSQLPQELFK